MSKANQKIREAAMQKRVYLWEIAAALNVPESSFVRKLRYELPDEMQRKIMGVIDSIAAER